MANDQNKDQQAQAQQSSSSAPTTAKALYELATKGGKATNGKNFVPFDQLSPSGQAAWQSALDAARDHATDEQQSGNAEVAASKDPNVKNQSPTGSQRT